MSDNIYKKPKKRGPEKFTTKEFIRRARKIHGSKYDYSKAVYNGSLAKVTIICPEHGEFQKLANNHLSAAEGCPVCSGKKITTKEFIKQAKKIHGSKYDYSAVVYKNANTKIIIICPEHGKFEQVPSSHISGRGCRRCGILAQTNKRTSSVAEFVKKARKVHGNKYDYSKVDYKNNFTKVIIICPEHGEFQQTPNNHLRGQTCRICSFKNIGGQGWDYSKSKKKGILYLLTCKLGNDYFYKIGITKNSINSRYSGHYTPFEIMDSKEIHGVLGKLYKMEQKILKELKDYKYRPKIKFAGYTECFKLEALPKIKKLLSKYPR